MINLNSKRELGTMLTEGGEGQIYKYKGMIAKIYKSPSDLKEEKIKLMCTLSSNFPANVVLPKDIVYIKNKFAGFVMNSVDGEEIARLTNKRFIITNNIGLNSVCKILLTVIHYLKDLHAKGIVVGDFNDRNILINYDPAIGWECFFIDTDSYAVKHYTCDVCMDNFKDPLLQQNHFSQGTDIYSLAVLSFQSLTRLHPFGGITKPEKSFDQRIKDRESILTSKSVIIPRTISNGWKFLSPALKEIFIKIFERDARLMFNTELKEFYTNLMECKQHGDRYYKFYKVCPVCTDKEELAIKPEKVPIDPAARIPSLKVVFENIDVKLIFDESTFLNTANFVSSTHRTRVIRYEFGVKYNFNANGSILIKWKKSDLAIIKNGDVHRYEKNLKSNVTIHDNNVYFISLSNNLMEINVLDKGTTSNVIATTSINALFDVVTSSVYFICNIYSHKKLLDISGYMYDLNDLSKIYDYCISYDFKQELWLFAYKTTKELWIRVFQKNTMLFETNSIQLNVSALDHICIYNGIIYMPYDGLVRGYNFKKNIFKDFPCDVCTADSKLIKRTAAEFIIINVNKIYSWS